MHSNQTASFLLQYDDVNISQTDGDALLAALADTGEGDFATLLAVFGGAKPATPITVTVNPGFGGSNDGKDMTIGSGGEGASGPFDRIRNTFIAELSEIFMAAQNKKWNPGDSKGEALSRALAGVMYPDGQQPGFTVHQWIDNDTDPNIDSEAVLSPSGRQDWVSKTFTGNANVKGDLPAKPTGCGLAFLFYLNRQLGFSWARMVSAADETFEGIYRQLTGSSGAFAGFIAAIDGEFRPGQNSGLNGTMTQPFSDGLEQGASPSKRSPRALRSPNGLTPTPLRTAARLSVRRYLSAEGLHGRVGLRDRASRAAQPIGLPGVTRDPLSQAGLRGLLNGRRSEALTSSLLDPRVFDAQFYLDFYPDLSAAIGNDLAAARDHWLQYGINEGRRGSRLFDVRFYLGHEPDLESAFGTNYAAAFAHWINQGLPVEGRRGSPEFDVRFYLAHYPDLESAFGTNYAAALDHWINVGIGEGRIGVP